MTEFISRKYGQEGYEVIVRTDDPHHYKEVIALVRDLMGRGEPETYSDLLRVLDNRKIAELLAAKFVDFQVQQDHMSGRVCSAVGLSTLRDLWYVAWMQWLCREVADE